jgi:leader peptidase (prepilin peptidase)/N-methyltransferase
VLALGGLGVTAVLGAILGTGSFAVLRFFYKLLRGKEGLGLGDVKMMQDVFWDVRVDKDVHL